MYQPNDPGGDYRVTLSQSSETGRIEILKAIDNAYSTSIWWDFYGERKSIDSEYNFDLFELGSAYESDMWKCFNIERRAFPYGTLPCYSDFVARTTSVSLEEYQSFCPEIVEYKKEKYPDNQSV